MPLTPGMGLKFLRERMDSKNLVAGPPINGQPGNLNFFAYDYKTFISSPTGTVLFSYLQGFQKSLILL